jgi:hypothetical protein
LLVIILVSMGRRMAEEFDPGATDVIVIPFIFVPHGAPPPTEWLRDHPDYVRLPAVFEARDGSDGAPDWELPDWELRLEPDVRKISAQAEPGGWQETPGSVFGIPGAQAQTRGGGRRSMPGAPPRSPAEEFRLMRFGNALRRLRKLEPANRELSFVRDPDSVPGEAWVELLEREAVAATTRRRPADAAPERSGLLVRDAVMQGDRPIGRLERYAGDEVRSVTHEEYVAVLEKLMAMQPVAVTKPGYPGQWYRLPDGTGFGLRLSSRNGDTIDFDNPTLLPGFKVHVK